MLVNEDEFVPTAIESTHPGVILDPDANILEFRIDLRACTQDL
jgi:hypothetical protein